MTVMVVAVVMARDNDKTVTVKVMMMSGVQVMTVCG